MDDTEGARIMLLIFSWATWDRSGGMFRGRCRQNVAAFALALLSRWPHIHAREAYNAEGSLVTSRSFVRDLLLFVVAKCGIGIGFGPTSLRLCGCRRLEPEPEKPEKHKT